MEIILAFLMSVLGFASSQSAQSYWNTLSGQEKDRIRTQATSNSGNSNSGSSNSNSSGNGGGNSGSSNSNPNNYVDAILL